MEKFKKVEKLKVERLKAENGSGKTKKQKNWSGEMEMKNESGKIKAEK